MDNIWIYMVQYGLIPSYYEKHPPKKMVPIWNVEIPDKKNHGFR